MINKMYLSSCEVPVILVRFHCKLIRSDRYFKNTHILNFMKICPVGADLLHVDGQTDRWTDGRTGKHEEANRSLKKVQIGNTLTVVFFRPSLCFPSLSPYHPSRTYLIKHPVTGPPDPTMPIRTCEVLVVGTRNTICE
jgi:hypothetical protein